MMPKRICEHCKRALNPSTKWYASKNHTLHHTCYKAIHEKYILDITMENYLRENECNSYLK